MMGVSFSKGRKSTDYLSRFHILSGGCKQGRRAVRRRVFRERVSGRFSIRVSGERVTVFRNNVFRKVFNFQEDVFK